MAVVLSLTLLSSNASKDMISHLEQSCVTAHKQPVFYVMHLFIRYCTYCVRNDGYAGKSLVYYNEISCVLGLTFMLVQKGA